MRVKLLSLLVTAALSSVGAQAAGVTDQMIADSAKSTNEVLTWGLGTQGQRYSPLKQINEQSIGRLVPIWSFSFGGEKQRGQESQPLVYNGKMFVTASYSRIYALDVKTGRKLWKYEHRLPDGIMPCCDVINRGAALYGNLVIFATLDAQLVALNQDTGEVVWKEKIDDYNAGYSASAAPLIAGGLLLTGVSGGEFGVVGRVEARNAQTGALVWRRPVLEGLTGELNGKETTMTGKKNESWPGDMYKFGGGAPWLGGVYDPETKLIFIGTGNPAPWNSWLRPGDNKWTSSRLAIDPENGEIKWGFQTTPHDGWDYDGVNEFISFDAKDGKKLGATADRNGFFYVLDRTNGKFLHATPFVSKI
ncbi:MAG: PQQ-dependent dehydrogenase, methanol/ethanol family, partial [Burkholderiales bacterium]|nr:PQQ-dependent dehydrogenase, methanol/ethanol family [Burkholderiales bacterium]